LDEQSVVNPNSNTKFTDDLMIIGQKPLNPILDIDPPIHKSLLTYAINYAPNECRSIGLGTTSSKSPLESNFITVKTPVEFPATNTL